MIFVSVHVMRNLWLRRKMAANLLLAEIILKKISGVLVVVLAFFHQMFAWKLQLNVNVLSRTDPH